MKTVVGLIVLLILSVLSVAVFFLIGNIVIPFEKEQALWLKTKESRIKELDNILIEKKKLLTEVSNLVSKQQQTLIGFEDGYKNRELELKRIIIEDQSKINSTKNKLLEYESLNKQCIQKEKQFIELDKKLAVSSSLRDAAQKNITYLLNKETTLNSSIAKLTTAKKTYENKIATYKEEKTILKKEVNSLTVLKINHSLLEEKIAKQEIRSQKLKSTIKALIPKITDYEEKIKILNTKTKEHQEATLKLAMEKRSFNNLEKEKIILEKSIEQLKIDQKKNLIEAETSKNSLDEINKKQQNISKLFSVLSGEVSFLRQKKQALSKDNTILEKEKILLITKLKELKKVTINLKAREIQEESLRKNISKLELTVKELKKKEYEYRLNSINLKSLKNRVKDKNAYLLALEQKIETLEIKLKKGEK